MLSLNRGPGTRCRVSNPPCGSGARKAALCCASPTVSLAEPIPATDSSAMQSTASDLVDITAYRHRVTLEALPETQDQLHDEAKGLASVFQRSSSNVEGRNGYLSLRSHQLRGLDLPRKRECFTAIHNFFLTRPDGTTAAECFFGQKPRSMFVAILASVELPPAPLSPPRRA